MPKALAGWNVVVTRPAHQAAVFSHSLRQHGANAIPFPLIEVIATPNAVQARTVLGDLAQYDAAIFISTNAVRFGLALLGGQQRQQLQHLTIGAIGSKTARTLIQQGLPVQWLPSNGFTSEDFLAIPAIQHLAGQRVLIFRGEGGRELLAETLQERGAKVTYVDCYQRVCPKNAVGLLKPLHESPQLGIIAVTSGEGLSNLLTLLGHPDWIKTVPLLVGSQRIATAARQAGFTGHLVIADNPGDEAMLETLLHWAQEFPR